MQIKNKNIIQNGTMGPSISYKITLTFLPQYLLKHKQFDFCLIKKVLLKLNLVNNLSSQSVCGIHFFLYHRYTQFIHLFHIIDINRDNHDPIIRFSTNQVGIKHNFPIQTMAA